MEMKQHFQKSIRPTFMQAPAHYGKYWTIALYVLFIFCLIAAVLNMMHLHVFFLTTHAADLFCPALLYIQARKSWQTGESHFPNNIVGRSPEIAAAVFFSGSVLTELSQKFFPHGIIPGTFDPCDIIAYAVGVGTCYILEKKGIGLTR